MCLACWSAALVPDALGHIRKVLTSRYAFQTAFAAFAVPAQSDRFYDLAGSLGFISSTLLSLVRLSTCPQASPVVDGPAGGRAVLCWLEHVRSSTIDSVRRGVTDYGSSWAERW